MENRIKSRLAKMRGTVDSTTAKADEIKHFNEFYNSCQPGSYIRGILDNAGINPNSVQRAIESDFDMI